MTKQFNYNIVNNTGNSEIEDSLNYIKNILDDTITNVNNNSFADKTFNIYIYEDDELIGTNTLGYAYWHNGKIYLNPSNRNRTKVLNDNTVAYNTPILYHEIMHVLGIGSVWEDYNLIDTNNFLYIGSHGVTQYKNLLTTLGYNNVNSMENYMLIEDDFGDGTKCSHMEEGINEDGTTEDLYHNGILYPVFPNEIMTGLNSHYSYLTRITLGMLEDLGFNVNYDSTYLSENINYSIASGVDNTVHKKKNWFTKLFGDVGEFFENDDGKPYYLRIILAICIIIFLIYIFKSYRRKIKDKERSDYIKNY